jgi:hypothetical protein
MPSDHKRASKCPECHLPLATPIGEPAVVHSDTKHSVAIHLICPCGTHLQMTQNDARPEFVEVRRVFSRGSEQR